MDRETVIIGAGPAGLAAAAFAPGGAVVLEARKSPGWKILISGGGHCNVTNTLSAADFLRRLGPSGRPLRYALGAFGPREIRAWLAERGCPTVVLEDWHVYPKSNRAADVLGALVSAALENGSHVICGARVTDIRKLGGAFVVRVRKDEFRCSRLIVAPGTPAYDRPQVDLENLLRRLGHTVRPFVPALAPVPLADNPFRGLAGVSLPARLCVEGRWTDVDEVLFTDDGLSGPAVLNTSARINRRLAEGHGGDFLLDLFPQGKCGDTARALLSLRNAHPRSGVSRALDALLPKRLSTRLVELARFESLTASQLKKVDADRLAALVHSFPCRASAIAPLAKGFAASGGIPLGEVNPRTMESKIVRGLFFAGEILDYDAPSGGFHVTVALATGRLAGLSS